MPENRYHLGAPKTAGFNTPNMSSSNTLGNSDNSIINNEHTSMSNTNTNIDTEFSSLMMNSSGFMDSNESYTALSVQVPFKKGLTPISCSSVDNKNVPLSNNNINSNCHQNGKTYNNNQTKTPILLDCSSFIDNSSFIETPLELSSSSTFNKSNNKILSELYSTPEPKIFDSQDSELDTPITPISTQFLTLKSKIESNSINEYIRYPLKDATLEKFVLSPDLFQLELDDKIGKGSNAYVYACRLSTIGIDNSLFDIAIKIPISKNKVKYIIQETKFALKLRNYQDEWFKTHNSLYPFIDCYGIYYLNRDQFQLFNRTDELPCLLMKKMTIGLSTYIQSELTTTTTSSSSSSDNNTKLHPYLWWKLCRTLLDALTILKSLNSVHCDLKTDNIMLLQCNNDNDNNNNDINIRNKFNFKVIDFSSATEVDKLTKCPDMTLQYTAPELLDFTKRPLPTFQSDLFSAGLVLLEAATGSRPYASAGYDHFYLLTVIKEGKVMDWLSPEDSNILKANSEITDVLHKILVERAPLEDVRSFVDSLHISDV